MRSLPAATPAVLLAAALAATAPSAHAQVADQGALEALFGEPVTTSATGRPQRISDVPVNMEIITAEDIRRSGLDNLPDILRRVPGVDVRRYGFAAADVGIRGYNRPSNPRLLVLINGQQVYLDDYGRTQWYALPVQLDEIRQIEVVKGPNSALYGFNAVSGVVNIITWDPLRDRVNAATVRGGTQGYGALSAVGTVPLGTWGGVRLSAGGFTARDFDKGALDPFSAAQAVQPRQGSLSADFRARLAPGVEATLSGSLVDLKTFEPIASLTHARGAYQTNAVRGALSADTAFGLLGLNLYRNQLLYNYRSGIGGGDNTNTVTVLQASNLLKFGADHTLRLGLEYRDNRQDLPAIRSSVGYEVFAASLMWDWQVTPQVSVTNAVRLDHLQTEVSGPSLLPAFGRSRDGRGPRAIDEVSFNSGLVWRVTELDTLRLVLARGLQAPSLFALGHQSFVPPSLGLPPLIYLGSADLSPTIVQHGELGYERRVEALASILRVAAFTQRTEGLTTDPFSAPAVLTPQGVLSRSGAAGDSSALGGEFGLRGGADGWRWNASYAYVSISDQWQPERAAAWLRFREGTPRHIVLLGGGYGRGPLELDLQGRWQSRFRDYRFDLGSLAFLPVEVKDYLQLDARIGYRVTEGLTLALTATQFNQSSLLQTGVRPVERRVFLSATARF